MGTAPGQAIDLFFDTFRDDAALRAAGISRRRLLDPEPGDPARLYEQAAALVERRLWEENRFDDLLPLYQGLFRELERHLPEERRRRRHHFVVVIPVADRPQHLQTCLESLLDLCRAYHYGGIGEGRFKGVSVVIADDSMSPENLDRDRAIADAFDRQGIETIHFGPEEQRAQVDGLPAAPASGMGRILGDIDPESFFHKGASITRNIAYLKLNELRSRKRNPLFHFVDSDQEFRVNAATPAGERTLSGLNYFHQLDRIFRETGARVVTGKVVGDPPVSPAVMAGNLLNDIVGFLAQIRAASPDAPCRFHGGRETVTDAAYHDMAELFGYKPTQERFRYACDVRGDHDHAATLARFAARLGLFFDGEHPTRRSYYQYADASESVAPARTVYTGNYVISAAGLAHFIPFAPLKLRMAGPALGRLIKGEIGERFVSANLPMLHRRTLPDLGRSEFRPGIRRGARRTDLSGEFERQFFGDVMLFSVERLTERGYPRETPERQRIAETVLSTARELHDRYLFKREAILEKLETANALLDDPANWWKGRDDAKEPVRRIRRFLDDMAHNFGTGAESYGRISDGSRKAERLERIIDALVGLPEDLRSWSGALEGRAPAAGGNGRP